MTARSRAPGPEPAGPPAAATVRLGHFSRSVLSRLARSAGDYAAQGLQVHESAVQSSTEQFRTLLAGSLDLILTSPDNVLNYRVNPANPLGARADVRILRAVDGGLGLSLLAAAGIEDVPALRGRAIGVDVIGSGFAHALLALLARRGLRAGTDYRLVALGSTPRRAAALLSGECAATLLNAGHDLVAEAAGCRRLARVVAVLGPYLGTVLAGHGPWLDRNPERVGAFLAAWAAAARRLYRPETTEPLLDLIGQPGQLPAALAPAALATLRDPDEGVRRDPRIPLPALATVVDLRAAAGGFPPGTDLAALRAGGAGLLDRRCCGTLSARRVPLPSVS